MSHDKVAGVALSCAHSAKLLEGPTRSVQISIPESDLQKIYLRGDDVPPLAGIIRMLCYGFIMATKEHSSFWQIERASKLSASAPEDRSMRATTIKIPDGLHEAMERISRHIGPEGVPVSAFVRGVVMTAAEGRGNEA